MSLLFLLQRELGISSRSAKDKILYSVNKLRKKMKPQVLVSFLVLILVACDGFCLNLLYVHMDEQVCQKPNNIDKYRKPDKEMDSQCEMSEKEGRCFKDEEYPDEINVKNKEKYEEKNNLNSERILEQTAKDHQDKNDGSEKIEWKQMNRDEKMNNLNSERKLQQTSKNQQDNDNRSKKETKDQSGVFFFFLVLFLIAISQR